jgi:hypothetical protein
VVVAAESKLMRPSGSQRGRYGLRGQDARGDEQAENGGERGVFHAEGGKALGV